MPDPRRSSDEDDFDARLRAAQARRNERYGWNRAQDGKRASSMSGIAVGVRITVEILAALAVGVGIGLVLDQWLGTRPWMLIAFFVLGAGAAFVNVMRTAREIDRRQRAERAERRAAASERGRGSGGGSG